jgi:hypothetical protein
MIQVQTDEAAASILRPLKERAELLDDQGTLIGYFYPVDDDQEALYRHAATLFDPDEVRESLAAEGHWSTTAEILDRLRSLGTT